jgi:hypothetical protein
MIGRKNPFPTFFSPPKSPAQNFLRPSVHFTPGLAGLLWEHRHYRNSVQMSASLSIGYTAKMDPLWLHKHYLLHFTVKTVQCTLF